MLRVTFEIHVQRLPPKTAEHMSCLVLQIRRHDRRLQFSASKQTAPPYYIQHATHVKSVVRDQFNSLCESGSSRCTPFPWKQFTYVWSNGSYSPKILFLRCLNTSPKRRTRSNAVRRWFAQIESFDCQCAEATVAILAMLLETMRKFAEYVGSVIP